MIVAEREVALGTAEVLHVQISEDRDDQFWRVQVTSAATARQVSSTTVGAGDSFLWHLISAAVEGDHAAWQHLARWGQGALVRPRVGLRSIA